MKTIMLLAEKECYKKTLTKKPWSPALKEAGQKYRYWSLRLKQCRGVKISDITLKRMRQKLKIFNITDTKEQVIRERAETKQIYEEIVQNAAKKGNNI